eukprot:3159754-Rhodomonas_salina.1
MRSTFLYRNELRTTSLFSSSTSHAINGVRLPIFFDNMRSETAASEMTIQLDTSTNLLCPAKPLGSG